MAKTSQKEGRYPLNVPEKTSQKEEPKSDKVKPKGSIGWLIFWIIFFWPVALFYGLSRRWKIA